jgi:hypothetical protein
MSLLTVSEGSFTLKSNFALSLQIYKRNNILKSHPEIGRVNKPLDT